MLLAALAVGMMFGGLAEGATPTVTDVAAKQRYPWNGLVDITCTVSGIAGTTNGLAFAVAAVMPDSGNVRNVSHFWVMQSGTNSTDWAVHTNGDYRLLWDARADLGQVIYSNMVVRVTVVRASSATHAKVQLWEGGPYWATTNIGAENPEDYGYYFWWGDTVGYTRSGGTWTDGYYYSGVTWVSSTGQQMSSSPFSSSSCPTYGKSSSTLQSEGWITADGVLAPEHDAAQVQWGGGWRMPTKQELSDLNSKCDWTWTTMNGVNGYVIRGRGDYASNSIFLPAAGYGDGTSLIDSGSRGYYWSSVPLSGSYNYSCYLCFYSGHHNTSDYYYRCLGQSVRPVQGFTE